MSVGVSFLILTRAALFYNMQPATGSEVRERRVHDDEKHAAECDSVDSVPNRGFQLIS